MNGYRCETEQLHAERAPLAFGMFIALVGGTGPLEYYFYPERLPVWLLFYAVEILVCLPLLLLRKPLQRRGWLLAANVAAWVALSLLMNGYCLAVGAPVELAAMGSLCLMTGTSLLMPWGLRGQAILVATSVVAYGVTLNTTTTASLMPIYLLFAVGTAGIISILGARHLELHRFAILCEATMREEEASVSQSLVAIAKEINGELDAEDALDRIAAAIRAALGCDWSLILLHEAERGVSRLVGSAGRNPEALAGLRGLELGSGVLPLVDLVLREHHLEIQDPGDADPVTAHAMRQWEAHALLASSLMRGEEVSGILLVGRHRETGRFSDRSRQLFRGIEQHATIALNNVRLVSDLRDANGSSPSFSPPCRTSCARR